MSVQNYSSSRSYSSGSLSGSLSGGYSQRISGARAMSVYGGSGSNSQRISGSRAMSVYGGAGSDSVRASYSAGSKSGFGFSSGSSGFSSGSSGVFNAGITVNEKATMQNLNDRLATYLEKVRALETSNAHLERQIREWYAKKAPVTRNYSQYEKTIAELRGKIQVAGLQNARIILQIDNAKLAADDFRVKYENELVMRQSVEADIIGLKRVLDALTITRSDLELQVEGLKEELIFLRKNHDEEMAALRAHISVSSVNVEVDAAPQQDLSRTMEEMRTQYEGIIEKNRRDMEGWYKEKFDQMSTVVTTCTGQIQTSRSEFTELKRTLQSMEIELQSQTSLKCAMEGSLAETQSRYSLQLSHLQGVINGLEAELTQMRIDIERQGSEYKMLLDIKTRLEMEIVEYRRLLDGEDIGRSTMSTTSTTSTRRVEVVKSAPVVTRKVRTVIEEVVDGKVVSRSEDVEIR